MKPVSGEKTQVEARSDSDMQIGDRKIRVQPCITALRSDRGSRASGGARRMARPPDMSEPRAVEILTLS